MAFRFLYVSLAICAAAGCRATAPSAPLQQVRSWAIQLQGLEHPEARVRLAREPVDLVVVEPMRSLRGRESFDGAELAAELSGEGRIRLAYLNVGQAEDYRTYWAAHWKEPTPEQAGHPSFLLTVDPEGWPGNFPVSYWDFRWRAVLWGSPRAPLDQVLADGFDGVYLDWVLGFEEPKVVEAARRDGVDAARAMAELIRDLRLYARRRRPGFLVVAQNAAGLVERVPAFAGWIDGVSQESVLFRGDAAVAWDDDRAGDLAIPERGDWSTETLVRRLRHCRARGLPVFTLEYARREENVARALEHARAEGFVPCVSLTPLDRLP